MIWQGIVVQAQPTDYAERSSSLLLNAEHLGDWVKLNPFSTFLERESQGAENSIQAKTFHPAKNLVVSQKESEMVGEESFFVTTRLPMSTPSVFKWGKSSEATTSLHAMAIIFT